MFYSLQNGNTPLHVACQANETQTVELLISKGADLNALNMVSTAF
jgi:ankyrin repeat protein